MLTISCRIRGCAFLLLIALGALVVTLPGHAQYCPSCLEQALINNGEGTIKEIRTAWDQYRKAVEILKTVEAGGTEDQKRQARALFAKLAARWHDAERMAQAYSSQEFTTHLREWQEAMTSRVARGKERLARRTDLYRRLEQSILGPQRQGVIRDMLGYEKEAQDLEKMLRADVLSLGINSVGAAVALAPGTTEWATRLGLATPGGAGAAAIGSVETFFVKYKGQADIGSHVVGQIQNAAQFREARVADKRVDSYFVAVQAAGSAALFLAPRAAAALGTKISTGILLTAGVAPAAISSSAVLLDLYMLKQATQRFEAAEQRRASNEMIAQRWQQQIKLAGKELQRSQRRLDHLNKEIGYQRRIADLYQQIQAERAAGAVTP